MKAAVRAAALVARHGRGFAASAEVAVAEGDPFLRFATPIPAPYNFSAALSSVPETKARLSFWFRLPAHVVLNGHVRITPLPTLAPPSNPVPILSYPAGWTVSYRTECSALWRRSRGCQAACA